MSDKSIDQLRAISKAAAAELEQAERAVQVENAVRDQGAKIASFHIGEARTVAISAAKSRHQNERALMEDRHNVELQEIASSFDKIMNEVEGKPEVTTAVEAKAETEASGGLISGAIATAEASRND